MRWLLVPSLVSALTGCQLVFQLDQGDDDDGSCSTAATLAEDFDNGLFPAQLRVNPVGTQLPIEDGVLVVAIDGDTTVTTRPFFDLRDRTLEASIEVRGELTSVFSEVAFGLKLAADGAAFEEEYVGIRLRNDGMLDAFYSQDLVEFEVGRVTYDPEAHRIWRFEQAGPETIWWVGDGESFTAIGRFQLPITNVQPELFVRRDMNDPVEDFRVGLDELRGGPKPEPVCATEQLQDDFDAIDRTRWEISSSSECATAPAIVNGQLELTWTPATANFCELETWTTFDLADSSLAIEHVVTPRPFEVSFLGIETMSRFRREFSVFDGKLHAMTTPPDNTNIFHRSEMYDPVAHRWLRLRGNGQGQLVWETSPDGITFAFFAQVADSELDAIKLRVGIQGSTAEVAPVTARFDHLNLGP